MNTSTTFQSAVQPVVRSVLHPAKTALLLKRMLFAALALSAGMTGLVHADDTASPLSFLVGAGAIYGGDSLVRVPFADGSRDNFKAGGLAHLYVGAEFRVNDRISLQNTIGYQINNTDVSSGGNLRFTRIPVDLLFLYRVGQNFRVGSGLQLVARPELKGTGVARNISQQYDATVGLIAEAEYLLMPQMGLKLRYVAEQFKPRQGGEKINGSHAGVLLSYYF
ncbi:outer membrane beta-barrel protein [Undibacterium sp. CY18W]|uniref:Outer membrane beta-barrel protein n=1 Tax=Undibacterium hunanense TaxID=2762292 RepID=A0ABR6ZVF6_9BURK|nr:outer membrane beta-barrel protein [Undibacterium hunanense]MBC3919619.1 outer membrane beta-barrel protein [Undibacterium hunanense]